MATGSVPSFYHRQPPAPVTTQPSGSHASPGRLDAPRRVSRGSTLAHKSFDFNASPPRGHQHTCLQHVDAPTGTVAGHSRKARRGLPAVNRGGQARPPHRCRSATDQQHIVSNTTDVSLESPHSPSVLASTSCSMAVRPKLHRGRHSPWHVRRRRRCKVQGSLTLQSFPPARPPAIYRRHLRRLNVGLPQLTHSKSRRLVPSHVLTRYSIEIWHAQGHVIASGTQASPRGTGPSSTADTRLPPQEQQQMGRTTQCRPLRIAQYPRMTQWTRQRAIPQP